MKLTGRELKLEELEKVNGGYTDWERTEKEYKCICGFTTNNAFEFETHTSTCPQYMESQGIVVGYIET